MIVCKLLNLEPAFFGAVSAVVNMQPSIALTVKAARDQVLVHLLGVGAGIAFGYVIGGTPLTMGIVTVLLIAVYIRMKLQSGISMGIVAAVFVLGSGEEQFIIHALNRTGVIFAGLTTAMLVNVFLWPPCYSGQFKRKLNEANEAAVAYFCRAIRDYARLENVEPDINPDERVMSHRLNEEARKLLVLIEREENGLASGSMKQNRWLAQAEKFLDYTESLAEKGDRIYELSQTRFNRRVEAGRPPVSEEFKAILAVLESGCDSIERVNKKIRTVLVDAKTADVEPIREDYWERLTHAIEQWQSKLTGSYYVHALIEAAVTANEIRDGARQAKHLLAESVAAQEESG
jgi:uncharacterized membrane protein YccC